MLMSPLARSIVLAGCLAVALCLAAPAGAVPVTVFSESFGPCDPLSVPAVVDELGDTPGFPADERITAIDLRTPQIACPAGGGSGFGALVSMTNLTGRDFAEVWYVGDPETQFDNVDGFVNGHAAFKIDAFGLNQPLVFESAAADGVFQAGETWDFIIDDYFNALGIGADAFFSPGAVGGGSPGGPSSGSIIAIIPEPASALLLALGLAGLAARSRPPA